MSGILHDDVKTNVADIMFNYDIDLGSDIDSVEELITPVYQAIEELIKEYTTYKYEFNLAMGFFVQLAHRNMEAVLTKILKGADLRKALKASKETNELNVYFTALYALSIIYKNTDNQAALQELSCDRYRYIFGNYPLYHEVLSRYYKRAGQMKAALNEDNNAIDRIFAIDPLEKNAGPRISYASTVCEMLKKNHPEITLSHIENAGRFIDEAIQCNDKYQKYPFIKAKFIFLCQYREGGDPALLIKAQKEAVQLIDLAQRLENLNLDNPQYNVDYEKFKRYMAEIVDNLRFSKSYGELDELKAKILKAESHKHCSASDILPPNPHLKEGDKYFFICYSSLDFKSVYCDLIELYKRKVHFMYDRRLANDVDWEEQVKEKINHEDCAGVVFYISENILLGDAVQNEIELVINSGKSRFRLNLENDAPSKILIDFIVKKNKDAPYYLSDRKMRLFLECFDDNGVFADKMKCDGDEGTKHLDSYISSLQNSFTNDIIGDL